MVRCDTVPVFRWPAGRLQRPITSCADARHTSGVTLSEIGRLHRDIRTDLVALLRDRDREPGSVGDLPVPACPAWTVKDTVAHLVGVGTDILSGNLDGVTTDPWTAAQVEARRGATLAEILEEWDGVDPQVEAISGAFGPTEAQWLTDCLSHDYDIRGALGADVEAESLALVVTTGFTARHFHLAAAGAGLPPLRLVAGEDEWAPADGRVDGTAMAPMFELFRGLTGRRSLDQIGRWGWDVACDPFLASFTWGPFTPRATPLIEVRT